MSDGPSNGVAAARLAALSAAMDPDEHQRVEALLARSGVPWVTETYGTGAPGDANLADLGTAERDEARALLAERASLQWAPPREISWPRVLSGECLANRLFTRRALIHKGELARALQCWRPWSAVAADGGSPAGPSREGFQPASRFRAPRRASRVDPNAAVAVEGGRGVRGLGGRRHRVGRRRGWPRRGALPRRVRHRRAIAVAGV